MRHFTLGLFLVLTASFMMAQNSDLEFAQQKLDERGEIYFTFPVAEHEIMFQLNRQISIDGFTDEIVYAYANPQEFATFLEYGIEFTPVYEYYNAPKVINMATTTAQMASWDRYPTHAVYEQMMQDFVTNYPGLCRLDTIGFSVNGWPIICLAISDNIAVDEDEPEFWWSGTMHGDETTGYVLLLRMADYLLSNYGTDPQVTNLVQNVEIYINPLANPDGTFNNSASGTVLTNAIRANTNGIDLNRNFPTLDGSGYTLQPESQCMMDYSDTRDFVMSVNTHGGIELLNFPWDTWQSDENINADHNWWEYVCFVYADEVEIDAPATYFEGPGSMDNGPYNTTGVTHGADWYYAIGSRQDYMNYYRYIQEVTLELSDTKTLGTEYLNTYWGYNKDAMLLYMEQVLYGLRGVVTDACTGTPLGNVKVEIVGHDKDNSEVYSSAPVGNYHRPIYEGTYDFTFSLAGYQTQTHTVTITNDVSTRLDVELMPDNLVDFTASPTSIFEGESVNFTDASSGTITSRSWTFEGGSPASSTDVNPAGISYATAGTYDVTLEIVSNGCTVSELKQDYITVAPAVPVVSNFIADQTTVPQGTTINFTDLSTNNPDDWSWTFDGGNPATSTDQNPSIVYNTPGTYDVVLTATNTYGGNTETKVGYITVTEADLLMSNGTATRCSGLFKDSGGDGQYENNENYTLTIYPSTPGSFVRLTFTEFDIEENTGGYPNCYDYLSIYDGENISATEIGSYCDVDLNVIGTNGVVTSTDPSGALTLNFSSDGGVVRDGWVAEISCYSPTDPPTANFTSDVTSTCTGIVQFEDLSTGATGWSWDFGDGNTSTEQDPQHTYTANGTYTVELTATNAYGTDVHEIIDMIIVDMPVAPVTTGAESCGEASLTISASGSGTLVWYDAATGGTEVTTGTSYTNTFSNTTTLYVQSEIDNTTTNYGGAPDNNYGTGGYFTNTNQHGLIFDTYQEFTLKSVKVYAQTAGDRTITLTDASDVEIQSTTINILAGESRIDLNFDVPIGNGLKLMGPGSPNMYRNQTGSSYPYTLNGILSINDNTAGNLAFYYYFYDWEVITGDYCISSRTPVTATINSIPDADAPTDVTACDSYILPALTNGDYFLSSGGVNPVSAGYEITADQTVYVYAETGTTPNCTAENSFVVTINETPVADAPVNVSACDSYILPALTNGDYFLSSGGVDPVAAGYEITADQTIYVYAETGTTPNCTAENSFVVTINETPVADAPVNVSACDSYILPALTNGDYFLSSGGIDPVSAGYEITGTTTVYVYAETGTTPNCTAENSFVVTINETPLVDNPDDVEVCDSYILPALTNGDYFLSSGGVDPVAAGYEITADEIVYVYSETGTTPNCTAENSFTVTINNAAQVDIGDNLTSACDGTVTLDAGTGYTSYTWQGVAGGQTYEATSTGIYTVVVEDANGCTSSENVSVTIIESPTVSVSTTPESAPGANDGTATANPLGGTSPYSYTWQVPYPGNPTITGLSGGTYCVTVHDFNMCTATACGTVDTDGVAPVANFSADETLGCDNLTVQFTDESANVPTSWEWDFGDGSPTSSEENPVHTYSAPGAYDVSLTVTNATGSDNTIEYSFIFVGETPSIDLSMTQANYSESNGSITVIATGGSTPYWYNWTGPNSFAGNNYTHADLPAGEYCVTVIENAANCEASDCIIITEIMPDPPVAAFSADVTEGCDNLTVQFTDESTNSPTTWAWDFGNGDTSDEQSPQYTYTTPGSYTVTLMVTNPGGSDDYFVTDMIVIGETPTLNLSMTEESIATGNDGTATVSITGGELPYDISWTGGFDTETNTGLAAGEYCVTVIESAGCEAYDCINVALEGIDAPIANFSADETEACGTLTVQFSDLSANDPTTWEWDFGDGSATSTEMNPQHTYSESGVYTVSLTVTNLGGSNNLTLTDFIVVNEKPVLSFEITHESSTGAADGEITLTITGGTEPYTINWSNNMHDLTITNLNAGLYSVAVIDANGCLASSVAEVTVSTEITNTDIVNCNVYPNPSYGSFIVESNTIPEVISIKDALGRSIQTIYPIANKTEINLEMSPGIYFINLSIDDNMIIKKLIIK